jgi:hypothetical protein
MVVGVNALIKVAVAKEAVTLTQGATVGVVIAEHVTKLLIKVTVEVAVFMALK